MESKRILKIEHDIILIKRELGMRDDSVSVATIGIATTGKRKYKTQYKRSCAVCGKIVKGATGLGIHMSKSHGRHSPRYDRYNSTGVSVSERKSVSELLL